MSRLGANSFNHGSRMEALQPLRSTKDSSNNSTTYSSKPKEKVAPSTPDFDRKKSAIGTSPLGKGALKLTGKTLVQSSQKPGIKIVSKPIEKENLLEKRISQLRLVHEASLAQIEPLESASKKDDSFEIQERKIRRETLLKDVVQLVSRQVNNHSRTCIFESFEALRRNSKIYSIQSACAAEFREASLRFRFLTSLKLAAEKYQFRFRLIRNFIRVFERLTRPSIKSVLELAFTSVQTAKRALHKTNMKQVKRGRSPPGKALPAPSDHKASTGLTTQRGDNKKSLAAINTSSTSTTVTNASQVSTKDSKLTTKKDTSRLATPVRASTRPTKEAEKSPLQRSTEKKTPTKTSAAAAPPPMAVAESISPSKNKLDDSVDTVPQGPRTSAILISCSSSVNTRHQEMKKKLLRQIQGGQDDEDLNVTVRESKADWTPETNTPSGQTGNTSGLLNTTCRLSGTAAGGGLQGFCPGIETSPEMDKPNIFFHSLTERPEEEDVHDQKLENKLSILMARKEFRRKA
jgi:hypothetical protein